MEAAEFFEKKAAGKAASTAEREAGQFERTAEENSDDAYRATRRRIRRSYGDDNNNENEESTPQTYSTMCPYCRGRGIVYATDAYGNMLVDYYGNLQTTTCGNCGGNGQVVVYQ